MEAKMESLGSQKHKNPETRILEKNSPLMRPQKVGQWAPWGGVREGTRVPFFEQKLTTAPEIVHIGPRDSKMTARASKMIENLVTLLIKNKTLEVKTTRRSHFQTTFFYIQR